MSQSKSIKLIKFSAQCVPKNRYIIYFFAAGRAVYIDSDVPGRLKNTISLRLLVNTVSRDPYIALQDETIRKPHKAGTYIY